MNAPSKIMVAVDFSENSDRALDAAIVYAKQFGAELEVFHAFTFPVSYVSPYEVAIPTGFFEELRSSAVAKLNENVAKAKAADVDVTSTLVEASVTSAIVAAVEQHDIDLLVLGTRGHTGLKHVLLGSVAERTLHRAGCSVLLVK